MANCANYLPFELNLTEYDHFLVALLIIVATKIWLDLVEGLFVRAFSSRTKSEADATSIFQMTSYVVWFVTLGVVVWVVAGGPQGVDFISLGLVSAAMIYVLQKPLLNIVGWAVLMYRSIYHLGDRIKINDVRGYVTNISVMNTTVREFGGWMSGDSFTGRLVSRGKCVQLHQGHQVHLGRGHGQHHVRERYRRRSKIHLEGHRRGHREVHAKERQYRSSEI
jgi:small-conductance mechanosensitive channel